MLSVSCFLPPYYFMYYQLVDINVMRFNVIYVLEEKKKIKLQHVLDYKIHPDFRDNQNTQNHILLILKCILLCCFNISCLFCSWYIFFHYEVSSLIWCMDFFMVLCCYFPQDINQYMEHS